MKIMKEVIWNQDVIIGAGHGSNINIEKMPFGHSFDVTIEYTFVS